MRKAVLLISWLLSVLVINFSCGLVPDLYCNVEITTNYIKSDCGLYNGVQFEELKVDSFRADQKPQVYKVVITWLGRFTTDPDRKSQYQIDFHDSSGKYSWWIDTTSTAVYREYGNERGRIDVKTPPPINNKRVTVQISEDSMVTYEDSNNIAWHPLINFDLGPFKRCPFKFKPDTWYYVSYYNFYAAYLYVDKNMTFNVKSMRLPSNY